MPQKLIRHLLKWRLILLVFTFLGAAFLPYKDSFPYRQDLLAKFGHPFFYSWANFDGVHYLGIAQNGYSAEFTQAFFPVFPMAISLVDKVFHNLLLSGLILSHTSFFFSLIYLYKLLRLDYSKQRSWRTLLFLIWFPTSFFFVSLYTESLFLLLSVSSIYYFRTDKKFFSYFLAFLASATRISGVLLILFFFIEIVKDQKKSKSLRLNLKTLKSLIVSTLPAGGLLLYMAFLFQKFGDPIYFLNAQPAFGAQRSADKIILLYQVMYRYLKMFATVDVRSLLFFTVTQEFFISILFFILIIIGYFKLRKSYFAYAFASLILPTLTGTFSSMPRYVLVLFPGFIVLSGIKNHFVNKLILIISAILLGFNTMLFIRGYWVA